MCFVVVVVFARKEATARINDHNKNIRFNDEYGIIALPKENSPKRKTFKKFQSTK